MRILFVFVNANMDYECRSMYTLFSHACGLVYWCVGGFVCMLHVYLCVCTCVYEKESKCVLCVREI